MEPTSAKRTAQVFVHLAFFTKCLINLVKSLLCVCVETEY